MGNYTDNSSLKSYSDNSDQNSHTDIHTVEIEYTCDQFFLDKSAILKHVETNNCHLKPGKKYYQSCNCNQTSSQTTDIPSHIGTNTGFVMRIFQKKMILKDITRYTIVIKHITTESVIKHSQLIIAQHIKEHTLLVLNHINASIMINLSRLIVVLLDI